MTSNEFLLLRQHSHLLQGPILEVGSYHQSKLPAPRTLFPDKQYIGLDIEAADGVDIVHDMEQPLEGNFNSVICCSVLEHVKRPWLVTKNIEDCLNVGGHLFVSAPFCWRYHEYPGDYWRFTHSGFQELFPQIDWKFLKYARTKPKCVYDSYQELINNVTCKKGASTIAVAMVIGFGVKK